MKINYKQVLFWVTGIISLLSVFGGVTGMQMLPLVAFLIMAWMDLKKQAKLSVAISVLAFFMAFVNAFALGYTIWADTILWFLIGIAWL